MSPEAITNRLKTMEQLWELSVNLMKAKPIEKDNLDKNFISEKKFEKELNIQN